MKKIFLTALVFAKIISLTVNAQQPGSLTPEIQDLILKASANQQGPMTESRLLSGQVSEINPNVKSWLKDYEESIIGTYGGPFEPEKDSKVKYVTTQKGNRIYVHVLDWKDQNNLLLPAILDRLVTRAWFLGDAPGTKYSWDIYRQAPWGTLIVDPDKKLGRVVVMEVEGNPKDLAQPRQVQLVEGSIARLRGEVAELNGNLTYAPGPDWIDSWTGNNDAVKWRVQAPGKGQYEVAITYACPSSIVGSEIHIKAGQSRLKHQLSYTSGWAGDGMNFSRQKVQGFLQLTKGENTIIVSMPNKKGKTVGSYMKLYSLELISPSAEKAQEDAKHLALLKRASTNWFSAAKYGLMVHWIPGIMPRRGPAKPICDAVHDFNVDSFADMVKQTGAAYLIFTSVHGIQWFPGPSAVHDRVLPGRTCDRDLIADLADAMEKRDIKLILYYHHGVGDYEWSKASGFYKKDKSQFFQNEYDILAQVGKRYGRKVAGWWFDDRYPDQPFEKLYEATKIGNPDRIVAWNSWIMPKSTEFQEYYSGEAAFSVTVPEANYFGVGGPAEGLQPHFLIIADDPWAHTTRDSDIVPPLYKDDELIHYVKAVNTLGGPVTINIGIYQDGTVSPATIQQIQKLGHTLGVLQQ
jgi:hypothetical protein